MSGAGKQSIGFVGIGNMGWPMAARLVQAGYAVTVQDARPEQAEAFAREIGGHASSDPAAVAAADVVITILPTSAIVRDVVAAMLPALKPGAVVIEMTSGVPSVTREIAARVAEKGATLIDAPVSGGVARAKTENVDNAAAKSCKTLHDNCAHLSTVKTAPKSKAPVECACNPGDPLCSATMSGWCRPR